MVRPSLFLASLLLLAPGCLAQAKLEATDIVDRPFSADFSGGGKLRLQSRSGEVHVIGVDEDRISVELSGRQAPEAHKLKVRLERKNGEADLRISGGPHSDLTITVRVPRNTDLYARIPFGEVHVENLTGNKNVSLHAGDLTISLGDAADYARVDASVITGEVDADAFGQTHGGLFRSFHKDGSGKYRVYAHVGAGQLTLE